MSDTPARPGGAFRRWLPWAVAAVLAALVVLMAIALPHVRAVSNQARDAADVGKSVALPTDYQAAVQAAATEAANILTYSRKDFDADWNRALAGSTGNLRKDQEAKRSDTLNAMTKNKIDLKAEVEQSAFESADGGQVLALVTVNGYTVNDSGVRSAETPQRLELTMVQSGGKWLASDLTMIAIQ